MKKNLFLIMFLMFASVFMFSGNVFAVEIPPPLETPPFTCEGAVNCEYTGYNAYDGYVDYIYDVVYPIANTLPYSVNVSFDINKYKICINYNPTPTQQSPYLMKTNGANVGLMSKEDDTLYYKINFKTLY
ncbi:MAG: hypothetical protein RSA04_00770, partial [Clostridiales bacterium]